MNKKLKHLLIASAVLMSVTTVSISSWAAASQSASDSSGAAALSINSQSSSNDMGQTNKKGMQNCAHKKMKAKMMQERAGWFMERQLGLEQNKQLSKDDAKIIAQAALLIAGRKDLSVGTITQVAENNKTFYHIDIVDKEGKVVSQTSLNGATGFMHPVN